MDHDPGIAWEGTPLLIPYHTSILPRTISNNYVKNHLKRTKTQSEVCDPPVNSLSHLNRTKTLSKTMQLWILRQGIRGVVPSRRFRGHNGPWPPQVRWARVGLEPRRVALRHDVRGVRVEQPHLRVAATPHAPRTRSAG